MYEVWYVRPELSRDSIMGFRFLSEAGKLPNAKDLSKTHIKVKDINAHSLEDVFVRMQAERWSPDGEAEELISKLGLTHTSMNVGDIIKLDNGSIYMIDRIGFKPLNGAI